MKKGERYTFDCAWCGTTVTKTFDGRVRRYCTTACAGRRLPRTNAAAREVFWSKVQVGGLFDCWEWQGANNGKGYSQFWYDGRLMLTHRLAYMWGHDLESIPTELLVCHHCDNPRCVNPSHLFLGTHIDNMADAVAKGRMPGGVRHRDAKLTDAQIPLIRQQLAAGQSTYRLAKQFGVSQWAIHAIKRNQAWRHVTDEGTQP